MTSAIVLEQPTGELWHKIRKELNENVATRDNDLAAIKTWLKQQPHLPDDWDDNCIMSFLRGCSFSLEKTKKKLDMHFTMRAACPEFFTNRDVESPELAKITKRAQGPTLPGLTPEGRRVAISTGMEMQAGLGPEELNNIFKLSTMMADIRLKEEVEGVAGDVYILDASIVTTSLLGATSLSTFKKYLTCVQEGYPVKLKEFHVINVSSIVEALYNLMKPVMKEKMKQRIHFHKSMESLYKFVPKEMLPTEYGGDAGTIEELSQAWHRKMVEYKDWFKAQETIKANEALRPGKPTNYDELFGIDGSFRQLSID